MATWIRSSQRVKPGQPISVVRNDLHFTALQIFGNEGSLVVWRGAKHDRLAWPWDKIADGQWHHYAATYHKDRGAVVYIDGQKVAENAALKGTLEVTEEDFVLGNSEKGDEPFAGDLDGVKVFSRALSHQEISALSGFAIQTGTGAVATVTPAVAGPDPRMGQIITKVIKRGDDAKTQDDMIRILKENPSPIATKYSTRFQSETRGDNFVEVLEGYVYPPATGRFILDFEADDTGEFLGVQPRRFAVLRNFQSQVGPHVPGQGCGVLRAHSSCERYGWMLCAIWLARAGRRPPDARSDRSHFGGT